MKADVVDEFNKIYRHLTNLGENQKDLAEQLLVLSTQMARLLTIVERLVDEKA